MSFEKYCDFCGKKLGDFYYILPHFIQVGKRYGKIEFGVKQISNTQYRLCENCRQKITVFIEKMKVNKR